MKLLAILGVSLMLFGGTTTPVITFFGICIFLWAVVLSAILSAVRAIAIDVAKQTKDVK
jgi:hypothetical protein